MLKDESLMPIGIYKGRQMTDVPANYLVYLLDERLVRKDSDVGNYIIRNLETLRLQAKNESKGIF